jgi:transposase
MIPYEIREVIRVLKQQGKRLREISRALKVSRNAVRRVLRQDKPKPPRANSEYQNILEVLPQIYHRCKGNGVRIREVLKEECAIDVAYSTLTRLIREQALRQSKRRRGIYTFEPGEEMQHDTPAHRVELGGGGAHYRPVRAPHTGLQPDALYPVLPGLHPFRGKNLWLSGNLRGL